MNCKKEKDWTGNGNSVFKTLGASNHTDKERETDDFYATHPKAIDALLAYDGLQLPKHIWEPSCGIGCLSKRLIEKGYDVFSSDLVDRGYGTGGMNFFEQTSLPDENTECILTNPPYKFATDYAVHALSLLSEGGYLCLFLKTTFAEGQDRFRRIFAFTPPFWFCSAWNEYYAPKTESLGIWKTTEEAQSVTPGGYGRRATKAKRRSTGSTTRERKTSNN